MIGSVSRLLPAAVLMCGACGDGASRPSLDSADPEERLLAIGRLPPSPCLAEVEGLVESLDSDDAAVRLMAITALERLSGERFGYDYRDPPAKRRPAIERWVEYAAGGARLDQPAGSRAARGAEADG